MKSKTTHPRGLLQLLDAFLKASPELSLPERLCVMKEMLRLSQLMWELENNVPIEISYITRESQL